MKKSIVSIMDIQKGDRIGVVGCHGKTTMVFYLSRMCKTMGKTLLTLSTKMYIPQELEHDEVLILGLDTIPKAPLVLSAGGKKDGKLLGYEASFFPKNLPYDYIIYEADGSRGLPLKAWEKREPVIFPGTTKTMGILPLEILDMELSEKTVFQYPLFLKRYGNKMNTQVLLNILKDEEGIFQYALGEKYFFLNGCDDQRSQKRGKVLIEKLKRECEGIHFFYGSAQKEEFYD